MKEDEIITKNGILVQVVSDEKIDRFKYLSPCQTCYFYLNPGCRLKTNDFDCLTYGIHYVKVNVKEKS